MGEEPDGGMEPPHDQPPGEGRRGRSVALGVGVLVLLAMVLAVALWPRDDEAAAPTTTERPTTSTTSTTVVELPGGTVEIATAKPQVTELTVLATEPEEWAESSPSLITAPRPQPEATEAVVPARDPLPTIEFPITGRFATEQGWRFANPGPYEPAQPFTMLVEERRGDWAKVQVPVRPNGTVGWVRVADVDLSTTSHRIEIDVSDRMLRAYDGTQQIAETKVVVGTAFTPTPTGSFYVTDIVPQTSPAFGPVALATDAYSEVMDEFDTGVPVVALHGTNRPELMGEARSNGCIRLPNEIIQQLADTMPQGTPVYIFA
jgi:lipoprotein-anchoring transpeptidase ErfK/SrfK